MITCMTVTCKWNICEHCPQNNNNIELKSKGIRIHWSDKTRKLPTYTYFRPVYAECRDVRWGLSGSVVLQLITEAQSDWDRGSVEDRPCLCVISSRFFLSVYGVKVLLGSCRRRCVHVSRAMFIFVVSNDVIRKKETKVYQQAAAEYQDDKSDLLYLSVILVLCESLLFRFTKKNE